MSYASLKEKGVFLVRCGDNSFMERAADSKRVFMSRREGGALMGNSIGRCTQNERIKVVHAIVRGSGDDEVDAVTECTLSELHDRLAIWRMWRNALAKTCEFSLTQTRAISSQTAAGEFPAGTEWMPSASSLEALG
jgi:hypothetical protein